MDLRTVGTQFVPLDKLPGDARYFECQRAVNGGGFVASERVIEAHVAAEGSDYRFSPEGPHPVPELRRTAGQN